MHRPRSIAASFLVAGLMSLMLINSCPAATTQPTHVSLRPRLICDVPYGPAGRSNLLDIYLPAVIDHPLPAIVWIHGGGWIMGDKTNCYAKPIVDAGFIVVSINYRLSQEARYPAQIFDCKGAIRFLRAHAAEYHIDADHIGIWGESAGGHLAALMGTSTGAANLEGTVGGNLQQSSQVQAVCDWFGPTDLTQYAQEARAIKGFDFRIGPPLILQLFGGTLDEKKELVQLANPIAFITPDHAGRIPPFLIMHGDQDDMVPLGQSQILTDALKSAGVPVDFQTIHGAGHGIGFSRLSIRTTMLNFFRKNLK